MKKLNKLVNSDMKHLNNCLSAHRISLDAELTELVLFKSPTKLVPDELKTKLSEKSYVHQNLQHILV